MVELRAAPLPRPQPGEARVRTLFSGISRGTERLVFNGAVGRSEWERMRGPNQEGDVPFPGQIRLLRDWSCRGGAGGAAWAARCSACIRTRISSMRRSRRWCRCRTACRRGGRRWPPTWRRRSTRCGTRAPGRATASSWWAPAWWGCWWRRWRRGCRAPTVTAVDVDAARAAAGRSRWARGLRAPEQAPGDADIVFHASATRGGLDTAINCAGFEGTIVEMSWYGDKPVAGRSRRRLPQPPAEARLLAGRPGLGRAAARAGTIGRRIGAGAAAAGRSPRSMRWSPRRSPSRTRRASCRASLRPARTASPPSSAIPRPDRAGETACTPSRCATAS